MCLDAQDMLEDLRQDLPFTVHLVDILTDESVHRRFWDKIPVVEIGDLLMCAPIHFVQLTAFITRAVRSHK
ncbi:MAG: hypothetical protein NVS4B8_00200 [Herpetosiphon sp.]